MFHLVVLILEKQQFFSKKRVKLKMFFNDVFLSVQVERLEVINKQYVRVILVPGANADAVRGTEGLHLHLSS